jgi:hypothetical protein
MCNHRCCCVAQATHAVPAESAPSAPVHHGVRQQRLQPGGGGQGGQQDLDAAAAAALVALAQQLTGTLHRGGRGLCVCMWCVCGGGRGGGRGS